MIVEETNSYFEISEYNGEDSGEAFGNGDNMNFGYGYGDGHAEGRGDMHGRSECCIDFNIGCGIAEGFGNGDGDGSVLFEDEFNSFEEEI